MKSDQAVAPGSGFCQGLIRAWLAVSRRKVRLLHAAELPVDGPAVFAVSHPAGLLPALILSTAMERPARCLLPAGLARGPLGQFLARGFGLILYDGEGSIPEAAQCRAIDVLDNDGSLVVFTDQRPATPAGHNELASTAAALVWRAETEHPGRRVAVHPVHLFWAESVAQAHEILIYVDTLTDRPQDWPAANSQQADTQALAAALHSRFQENAFQLQRADLDYFLTDLEEVLRSGLQEDWASRTDWKQDTDGFVLSGLVAESLRQANYLDPARLVSLRQSLDDYRRLQRQCALREILVAGTDSPLKRGWRGALVWGEMLLGLPIALYGLLNHLAIILVLYLARAFKRGTSRQASTQWAIRGAATLGFYALQIYLVAHWRGRAVAGYYAPTLPVSGAYLWRYVELVRPQARAMFISLTIPGLTRKIQRLRQALLADLERTLAVCEANTSVPQ